MNSIRIYLVSVLLATFSLVTFLAALNGYRSSMAEAETLMDRQLADSSYLLSLAPIPVARIGVEAGFNDHAFQIWAGSILSTHSPNVGTEAITPFEEGFRYANFGGYRWRTMTRRARGGTWIMVAERTDIRQQQVENIVLKSIMPLIWWLPVSGVLVWVIVSRGLRPLRELVAQIDRKDIHDFTPLYAPQPTLELSRIVSSTNALLARLAAAFEREKHFADNAAHELRTPLSALKVHLYNLRSELPTDSEALRFVNESVDRMQHLIEQILDLNRTNPDAFKAQCSNLDLHALVQKVTAETYPVFLNKNQSLELFGEPLMMSGDGLMLETMVQNILDNAAKYTPAGGQIKLTITREKGAPKLVVEDSGPGIPVEAKDRVFERFYRLGGDRHKSGTLGCGLGLAIVQHIAVLHNATIVLDESCFDSGLSFAVTFPADVAEAA
ncbi:MAG: two-component system sensor histidine kinase QseC [Halieaceae bacterium]